MAPMIKHPSKHSNSIFLHQKESYLTLKAKYLMIRNYEQEFRKRKQKISQYNLIRLFDFNFSMAPMIKMVPKIKKIINL